MHMELTVGCLSIRSRAVRAVVTPHTVARHRPATGKLRDARNWNQRICWLAHHTLAELFGGTERFRPCARSLLSQALVSCQRELARLAGIDAGNVSRLLKRWMDVGLVQRVQRDGLPRYYATQDLALAPLVTLMQQDSELVRSLQVALSGVSGIQAAVLFGSMARGEAGANSDVDVLVLGSVSELKLNTLLKPVGRKLGRPVHVSVSTLEDFQNQIRAGESFAREVVQGPRVALIGNFDAAVFS